MSYRSDVDIVVYGPKDQMLAFIAAERLQGTILKDDAGYVKYREYTTTRSSGRSSETWMVMWASFTNVKWYPDYPDVKAWEDLYDRAAELADGDESDICVEKAIIGEEFDDNTLECRGDERDFFLSISRAISVDLPPDEKEDPNG